MNLNHPEATAAALALLRNGSPFQWYVITLLALVIYIYVNEISNKNWNSIAAGSAYGALVRRDRQRLVQHFSGHALWTVPTGTAFLLLIGVGVELSLMFSVAGLIFSKLLPDDPKKKYLGINNRMLFAIGNAAFFSIFEIFLVKTPAFVWVHPWWGALTVFITVYIPFFAVSFYCYDWPRSTQKKVIGGLFAINALSLIIFAGILGWI